MKIVTPSYEILKSTLNINGRIQVRFICNKMTYESFLKFIRMAHYNKIGITSNLIEDVANGRELEFVDQNNFIDDENAYNIWKGLMCEIEDRYFYLVSVLKVNPKDAYMILPHSIKTDFVITAGAMELENFITECLKSSDMLHLDTKIISMLKILSEQLEFYNNCYDDNIYSKQKRHCPGEKLDQKYLCISCPYYNDSYSISKNDQKYN